MPRDLLRVLQRPPFERYAVIPVAGNVWQQVEGGSPTPDLPSRDTIPSTIDEGLQILDAVLEQVVTQEESAP